MAILNTVSLVLNAFNNRIKEVLPEINTVYDPNLDPGSSKELSRIDNEYNLTDSNTSKFPLLVYNRSVLNRSDTIGKRGYKRVYDPDITKLNVDEFRINHALFDFRYLFVSNKMTEIEEFEILHANRLGLHSIFNFDLDLSKVNLGTWHYFVDWVDTLDSMNTTIQGSTYKTISGICSIRGFFITIVGTRPVINNIYMNLYGPNTNAILDSMHITTIP
jgi:hypothetical protein